MLLKKIKKMKEKNNQKNEELIELKKTGSFS